MPFPVALLSAHRNRRITWRSSLIALLVMGLAIRFALMPVTAFVYDRMAFTDWMIALQRHPFADFYHLPQRVPADHLPGTLWLLAGLGNLASWMGIAKTQDGFTITPETAQPFLKILPILADLVNGLLIAAIVRKVTPARPRAALFAAASWFLAPGVIFVSAVWAQWDAISLVFVLIAIWCAVDGRRGNMVAVPPLLALAMLMKPQFAILAPLLGFALLISGGRSRRTNRPLIASITALAVGGLLAVSIVTLAGWPFHVGLLPHEDWTTYSERIRFAANRFHGTTYSAISLWIIPIGTKTAPADSVLIPGPFPLSAGQLGWLLVAVNTIAGLVIAHRHRWNAIGVIAGCAVTYLGFVLFATRMHERYLMPALAFTVLLAGIRPVLGTILPAITLSLAYAASVYLAYTTFAFNPHLPFREWRTGLVLSALGVIGIVAFLAIIVAAWSMPSPEDDPATNISDGPASE